MKILSILYAILFTLVTGCYRTPDIPSDAEMKAAFIKHADHFQALVTLADLDSAKGIIAPGFVVPAEPPLSESQHEEYRRLFDELGVKRVFRKATLGRAVFLPIVEWGNPSGGFSKGLYHGSVSSETTNSLDDVLSSKRKGLYFAELQDGWYLYFERD